MTYAEKRAEVIASARAGDLSPLNAFVDQLRHVGMPNIARFDYQDVIAFMTHKDECTEEQLEDWFYEIDHLSSQGEL